MTEMKDMNDLLSTTNFSLLMGGKMMIDEKYQGNGYSRKAMMLAIEKLKTDYNVSEIHIGHRKTNAVAGKLYESLGFKIIDEDEKDYFRNLDLS